jgi:hypothetical protein
MLRSLRALTLALACCAAVVVSGCATTPVATRGTGQAAGFTALAVGNAWTYRVTPGPDAPQVVTITSRDEQGYFLDDKGGRWGLRGDSIVDGSRALLQEPIEVGATWSAVVPASPQAPVGTPGVVERYTITATDAVVTVPAGTFNGCVEVEASQRVLDPNSGKPATLLLRWTWAPKTGLVRIRQSARLEGGAEVASATMELLSFTAAPATP